MTTPQASGSTWQRHVTDSIDRSETVRELSEKQSEIRNKNIPRFERKFQVGDLVKSNKLNSKQIQFGIIRKIDGNKFISFEDISTGRLVVVHCYDIERIPFSIPLFKTLLE